MATRSKKAKATTRKSVRKVKKAVKRSMARPYPWLERHPVDATGAVI
jgi:hypothetical protein